MSEQPEAIRVGSGQRRGATADQRLDWWRDAKFGLFIHWGLYAIPAGEWKGQYYERIGEWLMHEARIPIREYEPLAKQFNPTRFDAAEWVSLAKRAGQKYLVITSKHHDGFCMYDSKLTDYTVVKATPWGRDPMKELAAECQRQGIKLCFYYSQTQDWHHPQGDGNDWDFDVSDEEFATYVEGYVKPQVTELLTNYGPIGLIWFDTPKRMTLEQSESLVELVHRLQPDCLVNGRVGNHVGDYASTRDNVIPAEQLLAIDWEVPATINDTWGFKRRDENWKSTEELIRKLVDVTSKGGNYLLNVGPTAEGVIPQPSVDRLLAMGKWLETNGDAIYGTRPGPVQGVGWCRTTQKDRTVYLHVFDWPADGLLRLPDAIGPVQSARLLATGASLPVEGALIRGPASAPDAADTVVALGRARV
jgi:alpha-L-fucosidase